MSFEPVSEDHVRCRECATPISLETYRRFGLCTDCEVEREVSRLQDTIPASWTTHGR
jgi:hypothetical protein